MCYRLQSNALERQVVMFSARRTLKKLQQLSHLLRKKLRRSTTGCANLIMFSMESPVEDSLHVVDTSAIDVLRSFCRCLNTTLCPFVPTDAANFTWPHRTTLFQVIRCSNQIAKNLPQNNKRSPAKPVSTKRIRNDRFEARLGIQIWRLVRNT